MACLSVLLALLLLVLFALISVRADGRDLLRVSAYAVDAQDVGSRDAIQVLTGKRQGLLGRVVAQTRPTAPDDLVDDIGENAARCNARACSFTVAMRLCQSTSSSIASKVIAATPDCWRVSSRR